MQPAPARLIQPQGIASVGYRIRSVHKHVRQNGPLTSSPIREPLRFCPRYSRGPGTEAGAVEYTAVPDPALNMMRVPPHRQIRVDPARACKIHTGCVRPANQHPRPKRIDHQLSPSVRSALAEPEEPIHLQSRFIVSHGLRRCRGEVAPRSSSRSCAGGQRIGGADPPTG